MKLPIKGAIDCDLHPAAPSITALMPHLDDFWREHLAERYIDKSPFTLASYAPNLPQSVRQDWRPAKGAPPGADLDALRTQALDAFGTRSPSPMCCMGRWRCSTPTWRRPFARR